MKRKTTTIYCLLTIILALAFFEGCSQKKKDTHLLYHRFSREFVSLYSRINPISASSLGIRSTDPNLFTFKREEIDSLLTRLKQLEEKIDELRGLDSEEYEKENLILILYWLRGEMYALEKLESYSYNPILYTWVIEKALFDIPERTDKPYRGEYEAYIKRISKLEELTAEAKKNLANPATAELKSAVEAIDGLLAQRDYLREVLLERYGKYPEDTLSAIFKSIKELEEDFKGRLNSEPRSRTILGLEELSKIVLYDECINIDPNSLIKDAERMIRTLRVRRNSLLKKIELKEATKGEKGDLNEASAKKDSRRKSKIEEKIISLVSTFVSVSGENSDEEKKISAIYNALDAAISRGNPLAKKISKKVKRAAAPSRSCSIAKSYLLSLPVPRKERVCAVTSTVFTGGVPTVTLLYDSNLSSLSAERIIYSLLAQTPTILRPRLTLLGNADTVRTLLISETYQYGWHFVKMRKLIDKLPIMKDKLSVILADEKIEALARMIVSLELNSGTITLDEAKEKFIELSGTPAEEAENEVILASTTPSSIYPGASIVIVDKIYRLLSSRIDIKDPRRELEKTLTLYPNLPLMLILEKVKE